MTLENQQPPTQFLLSSLNWHQKKKNSSSSIFYSLTVPFLALRGYCLQPRKCCRWTHETSAYPQNRCNNCDHQGGKWYGHDHGHEKAVEWEFLGKGMVYWRSFGFLDCAYKRIMSASFPPSPWVWSFVPPPPQKSHLSIAFLYRILRSCWGLASVCKSILPFLIFLAWVFVWVFLFHIY